MALELFRAKKGFNIAGDVHVIYGAGVPNDATDVVAAPVGSLYIDTTNKDLYQKQSIAAGTSADWEKRIARDDLDGIIGVSGDNLGTFSGNIIADNSDIKVAIQAIETQVDTNIAAISTNSDDISTNTSAISTNSSNISTNTTNIGSNVSAISSNSSDISDLQGATGVTDGNIDYANNNYIADNDSLKVAAEKLDSQVKTNADAIASITTSLSWKKNVKALTADADLNSASNGDALSTLLPFSDDEGTQLAIGDFADGDFILSQNGTSSKLFYVRDDAGTLKVEDSTGTGVPADMEALANGHTFYVKYDLADSPDAAENSAIFAYNAVNLVKIGDFDWDLATGINLSGSYSASAGSVASGDTIEAAIQKLDGNVAANSSSISTNASGISTNASGISTNVGNISTNTSGISTNASAITGLQTGSGVSSGTIDYANNNYIVDDDSLKVAVEKLDAQIATNASGISTNASGISTNSSGISTNSSAITNLQGALGAASEAAIDYSSNNYVVDGVDAISSIGVLDSNLKTVADSVGSLQNHSNSDAVTTETVVSEALVDEADNIQFKIVVKNASGKYSAIVDCLHDGKSTDLGDASNADATVVDYSAFSEQVVGTEPTFSMSVELGGTGASQKVELRISAGTGVDVRAYRLLTA